MSFLVSGFIEYANPYNK